MLKELLVCVQPLSKVPAEEQAEEQANGEQQGLSKRVRVTCQQERSVDGASEAPQGTEVRTHARHSDQRRHLLSSTQL